MSGEYDAAIIGGGLTGLCAAYCLSKYGEKVILIEKEKELGGLLSSWNMGDYHVERYYHHLSKNDTFFVDFLDELGLKDKLNWKKASVGYYYDKKLYKMDTPFDILRFKGLSLVEVLKLGLIVLKVKLKKDYFDLDNVYAKEWILKNGGDNLYRNFFEPLLKGKYGKNANRVSAAWLFGRLKFRSKRSLSGEKLGYPDHGFHELVEKMSNYITDRGGEILKNTDVKRIEINNGSVSGLSTSKGDIKAKKLISTISSRQLLKICDFSDDFIEKLKGIEYQGTICALFGLKEKLLDGIYWLNIKSETLPFGAIIEHTNFHNLPEYKGEHIVYVVSYIQNENDRLCGKTDEEVIATFTEGLEKAFNFKRESIIWWRLAKDMYTAPIYEKEYLAKISKIKSPIKNLFITGMFLLYPERSMDGAIAAGFECAETIWKKC